MLLFALITAFLLFIPLSFFIWIRQNKLIVCKYDENQKLLHLNDYPILGASLRLMGDGEGNVFFLYSFLQWFFYYQILSFNNHFNRHIRDILSKYLYTFLSKNSSNLLSVSIKSCSLSEEGGIVIKSQILSPKTSFLCLLKSVIW